MADLSRRVVEKLTPVALGFVSNVARARNCQTPRRNLWLVEQVGRASEPGGAVPLIVDVGARVAVVEGRRVELPPRLFELLAALAEQPGEPVSHPEIVSRLWDNPWGITRGHVRYNVWRLRTLLGDDDRDRPLIGNRRGHGYALELPPEAVRVVDGLRVSEASDPPSERAADIPSGIAREEENAQPVEHDPPRLNIEPEAPSRKRMRRGVTLLAASLVTILMLGSGWFAVSRFSQRDVAGNAPPTGEDVATTPPEDDPAARPQNKRDRRAKNNRKGKVSDREGIAVAQPAPARDDRSPEASVKGSRIERKDASADKEPDDSPRPRPTSQLYHLHNPETGDHYMTTSSSESNQKQAAGYTVTVEGRVFSKQVKGTVAIALDNGTTYIYKDASSNTDDGTSITKLYRLDKEDDYFYTSSSSAANQAEAQGWARTVVGYVA